MTVLIFNLEGHHCALTGKQTTHDQSKFAKKSGSVAGVLVDEAAAEAQHENAASIPETLAAVEIFAAALAGALTLAVVGILAATNLESPFRRRP